MNSICRSGRHDVALGCCVHAGSVLVTHLMLEHENIGIRGVRWVDKLSYGLGRAVEVDKCFIHDCPV